MCLFNIPAEIKLLLLILLCDLGRPLTDYTISYYQDSVTDGRVSRVMGYSMEPMRLNLAGCIEPAL